MNVATAQRGKPESFSSRTSLTTVDDNYGVGQFSSTSLDALGRPWTTVGQPKPCETNTRAAVRRALVAESGKKGRVRGSEADLAQCGAMALPPPFLFLAVVANFFQRPLFYCIPTDRTAFGNRTWPRLVWHVGLRLVCFGGDGVCAKCHSNVNLTMPRLVFCWRRLFVLFNKDAFLCDPAQEKETNRFLRTLSGGGGGGVRPIPPNRLYHDRLK